MTTTPTTVSALIPADHDEFAAFLAASPAARFSHELAWATALLDTYGLRSEHLIARRAGRIVGALPLFLSRSVVLGRHLTSCPFPSHARPVHADDEALDALLGAVAERTPAVGYTHVVCAEPLPATPLLARFVARSDDLTFRLPLATDKDALLSGLSKNIRRDARAAERQGVMVSADRDGARTDEFYRLYSAMTAKKHGMPPHSRALFENLWRCLGPSGMRVHFAHQRGRCLAVVMTLRARGEIYYAWSASDPAESALNATTLVLQRIIEEGCEEGMRVFDMGESPKEHEGLVRFKRRWCPVELETHGYFLLGRATSLPVHFYGGFGWQKRVIARLPVALTTRLISPLLRFVV